MKVLFKKLVVNVGHPWDIKEVKIWYAQNFLFPKGFAIELTPDLEKKLKEDQKKKEANKRELIENKHNIIESLSWKVLNFKLQTWAHGKVFGWIGEKDILKELKAKYKVDLNKSNIMFQNWHIKTIWKTEFFVNIWKWATCKMFVNIESL